MKIKTDFVTNSSSVSFVVMGASIETDLLSKDLLPIIQEKCKDESITWEDVQNEPMEYIELLFDNRDFEFSSGHPYGDEIPMVGIPYTRMGEDETKGQLRQRVKDGIKTSLGIDVTPGHIEECWENR